MRHIKSEFDKLTFKEFFTFGLAAACMAAAFVLVFVGIYMPPQGEIHPTIITIFGLCLGFVGAILGINNLYEIKTEKMRAEILDLVKNQLRTDDFNHSSVSTSQS